MSTYSRKTSEITSGHFLLDPGAQSASLLFDHEVRRRVAEARQLRDQAIARHKGVALLYALALVGLVSWLLLS